MSFKIGFSIGADSDKQHSRNVGSNKQTEPVMDNANSPKKSLVDIYFPTRDLTCTYYNDKFDLCCGDIVYVDGKLEGVRGTVVNVSYTFKIKLSDYKRVVAKVDLDVKGDFIVTDSHLITFVESVIPFEKVITWFKAPCSDDEVYVTSDDSESFYLDNFNGFQIRPEVADRGNAYYMKNRVSYVSVFDGKGHAIVEGSQPYVVEFMYNEGKISNLVCNCYCADTCKHEFAAMLQLRDIINAVSNHVALYCTTIDNFAAISKDIFKSVIINNKSTGKIMLV